MPDIETRLDRLETNIEKLVNVVSGLAGVVQEITVSQKANVEASEQRFRHMEALQTETTEKLNALIQIVDEWIRNHPAA
jgi:hypothetical protein